MNRKKILAAALSAVMLMSVNTVYAAETKTEDAVSDFVKPGTDGTKVAQARAAEKPGVQKMVIKLKKFAQLENAVGQAASELSRSKEQAAAEQVIAAQTAAADYAASIREAAKRSPLYDVPAEPAEETAPVAEPVYMEPVYTEAVYSSPLYAEAVYTAPVYTEPVYSEPVYTEPAYTEPVYTAPAEDAASAAETADTVTDLYGAYTYDDSLYTEPVYEDPYAAGTVYDDIAESSADDLYGSDAQRASVSNSDLDLLASIIYCEAGGESYEGQVAVGAVVLNRMESELYPDDMTDVIYQSGQFTPAMTGWLDQVRESGVPDYCYESAQAALNGENPVGDCLYFHAGGGDGLTIGNQTFY